MLLCRSVRRHQQRNDRVVPAKSGLGACKRSIPLSLERRAARDGWRGWRRMSGKGDPLGGQRGPERMAQMRYDTLAGQILRNQRKAIPNHYGQVALPRHS